MTLYHSRDASVLRSLSFIVTEFQQFFVLLEERHLWSQARKLMLPGVRALRKDHTLPRLIAVFSVRKLPNSSDVQGKRS